ncbi:MAG: tetratricopeptide repeat protein [Gemmatimonadales bacterium]
MDGLTYAGDNSLNRTIIVAVLCALGPVSLAAQSPTVLQGRKLFEERKFNEARAVLEPVGKTDATGAFLLGRIALEQNDPRKSVDWLEKAVELSPRSSEYWDWLGRAYGSQAQNASKLRLPSLASKTKNAWEKAVALDPENLEARQDIIQYYLQAPGFLGGSKDKARAMANEIKRRNQYRGAFAIASVCNSVKDHACVEREMQFVATTWPDSAAVHSQLAAFYTTAKQYDRAFAVLDKRLQSKPSESVTLYALGRTASISGQNLDRGEQALRAYLAAPVAGGAAPANAHYRLGLILEKKGDKSAARSEYQTALQLNPGYREAKKALAALGG